MENIIENFKIKRVSIILLLSAFIWNQAVYYLGLMLGRYRLPADFTLSFDRMTPFIPWTICIYFGCFILWVIVYSYIAFRSKKDAYRFFLADFIGKLICFIFFVVLPTTNIRPAVTGNDFWSIMVKFLYRIDAPSNLFPSIHCMVSWFCWAGLRKQKGCPLYFQLFTFIMAVAVCISTLTTKQHVIIDAAGAILISEAAVYIAQNKVLIRIYRTAVEMVSYSLCKIQIKRRKYCYQRKY